MVYDHRVERMVSRRMGRQEKIREELDPKIYRKIVARIEGGKLPIYPTLIRKKAVKQYKAEKQAEIKRKQVEAEVKIQIEIQRRAEARAEALRQQKVVAQAKPGGWVRINPDGSVSHAGFPAYSPSEAKALGFKWGTTLRKYDKTGDSTTTFIPLPKPTEAEFYGLREWKLEKGHYAHDPELEKRIRREVEIGGEKYGITAPAWAEGYLKEYERAAKGIKQSYKKAVESQKAPSGYELREITLGEEGKGLVFGYVSKPPPLRKPPIEPILPPTKKIPDKQVIPKRDEPKYKEVPKGFIRPTPYAPKFSVVEGIPSVKRVVPKPSPLPSPTTIPLTSVQAVPLKIISSIGEKVKEVWTWKPKTIREAETAKKEVAKSFVIPTKDVDKLIGKYGEPPKEVKERYKKIEDYETESTRFRIKYGIPDKPATGIEAKALEDLYMSGKMSKSVYDKLRTGKFEIPVEIEPEAKTTKRLLEQSDKIARQKGWLKEDRLILPTQPTGGYTPEAQKWLTTYEKALETAKPYEKTTPAGVVMFQFPFIPTKIGEEIITGSKALETKYKALQVKSQPVREYETWLGQMFQKTPTGEFKTKSSGELVYKPVIKKYLESQEKVTIKGIIEEPSKGFITKPVTTALISGGEWWREKVGKPVGEFISIGQDYKPTKEEKAVVGRYRQLFGLPKEPYKFEEKLGTMKGGIVKGLVVETPAATAEVLGLGTYAGEFVAREPKKAAALALPVAVYTGKGMYQFGRERPGEFLGTMLGMKYTLGPIGKAAKGVSPIRYAKIKVPTGGKTTKFTLKTKTIWGKQFDLPMVGKGWKTGGIKIPVGITRIKTPETITVRELYLQRPTTSVLPWSGKYPVLGITSKGLREAPRPLVGTPKLDILSYQPKTGVEAAILLPSIKKGLKPEHARLMESTFKEIELIGRQKSIVKRPIDLSRIESIPKEVRPVIMRMLREEKGVVFGSGAQRTQQILRRPQEDIDYFVRNPGKVAEKWVPILNKAAGKEIFVAIKRHGKPTGMITVLKDGRQMHAIDMHSLGELKGRLAFGFKPYKPVKIDGIKYVVLEEQLFRKGLSITQSKGKIIGPEMHRMKDIADFISASKTLKESMGLSGWTKLPVYGKIKLRRAVEAGKEIKVWEKYAKEHPVLGKPTQLKEFYSDIFGEALPKQIKGEILVHRITKEPFAERGFAAGLPFRDLRFRRPKVSSDLIELFEGKQKPTKKVIVEPKPKKDVVSIVKDYYGLKSVQSGVSGFYPFYKPTKPSKDKYVTGYKKTKEPKKATYLKPKFDVDMFFGRYPKYKEPTKVIVKTHIYPTPKIEIPKTVYPKITTKPEQYPKPGFYPVDGYVPSYPPAVYPPTKPIIPFIPSIWIPIEPTKSKPPYIKPKKDKKLKPRRRPFGAYQLDVTNPILSPVELLRMMGGSK